MFFTMDGDKEDVYMADGRVVCFLCKFWISEWSKGVGRATISINGHLVHDECVMKSNLTLAQLQEKANERKLS